MKEINPNDKEIVVIKEQVDKASSSVESLELKTIDDLEGATKILSGIKTVQKMVDAEKKKITDPINSALKAARAFFSPFEDKLDKAESVLKSKMLVCNKAIADAAKKAEVKVLDKVESGYIKPETAVGKLEAIQSAPTIVKNEGAKSSFITRKVAVIVDESLIPREYLVPDMKKIQEDAVKNVISIPGIKVEERQEIRGYGY